MYKTGNLICVITLIPFEEYTHFVRYSLSYLYNFDIFSSNVVKKFIFSFYTIKTYITVSFFHTDYHLSLLARNQNSLLLSSDIILIFTNHI